MQREHDAIENLGMSMSRLQNDLENFDSSAISEEIEGIIRARFGSRLHPRATHAHFSRRDGSGRGSHRKKKLR